MSYLKYFIFYLLFTASLALFNYANAQETKVPKFSMQQCIDYAIEHSPTLANQKITVHNQKLQTIIEQAQFAFKLTASDSHYAQAGTDSATVRLSKELTNGFNVSTWLNAARANGEGITSNYVALQISKTILGGGTSVETTYDIEASMLDEIAALNLYNKAKRELAQDVKIAYYTIILAQQSLLVKRRALENAKHTLALTREREKPLDILTAEIRIPANELSVNTALRTIKNGLDSLKKLMGMPVEEPFDITGDFDFKVVTPDLQKDLEYARDNLESIINNRLTRKKLTLQSQIYQSKNSPTLSLAATHYQYGNNDSFNFNGTDEQIFSLNLSWNLGLRAEAANLAATQNKLQSNQNSFFSLNQALTADLTSYHRRLLESADAVRLQESLCDFQKRKEELYRDKWENGEIDILELVRTQTDLEDSFVELITKKITYLELQAYYDYTRAK